MDKFISGDKVMFINRNHQRVYCQIVGKHPDYDKNNCYIVTTNIEGYCEFLHESHIEKINNIEGNVYVTSYYPNVEGVVTKKHSKSNYGRGFYDVHIPSLNKSIIIHSDFLKKRD